jgi:hypothetical protein
MWPGMEILSSGRGLPFNALTKPEEVGGARGNQPPETSSELVYVV